MDEDTQPGVVVSPSVDPALAPPSTSVTAPPDSATVQPPGPQTIPQPPAGSLPPSNSQPTFSNVYAPPAEDNYLSETPQSTTGITWQADEFENTSKSSTWYGAVTLAAIIAAIVVFFVTGRDFFVAGVVLLAIMSFAYLASRRPNTQLYAVDDQGVRIGQKLRPYEDFRNYAINDEEQMANLVFIPHKRFSPPLVIQVPPEQEQAVVEYVSLYLPLEEHKPDAIDALVRRMRL